MRSVLSVNIGAPVRLGKRKLTGIDKRPVTESVDVRAPGAKGSGLAGDSICNPRHHGGDDQAVYAYAREDLDTWAAELDRPLPPGTFGENLTTTGVDIAQALIGERWQVGAHLVLEVTVPRIPCSTFARWLGERGWVKTFAAKGKTGAYLRVVESGAVRAGDPIEIVHRPGHDITVEFAFRALTTERELLPRLLVAGALPEEARQRARAGAVIKLDSGA